MAIKIPRGIWIVGLFRRFFEGLELLACGGGRPERLALFLELIVNIRGHVWVLNEMGCYRVGKVLFLG